MKALFATDVTCPYCYLAHRNLVDATGAEGVTWQAFVLDLEHSQAGVPWTQYLDWRFEERAVWGPMLEATSETGRSYGVEFRWDLMTTYPDSRDAHRVIVWAGRDCRELQNRVADAIMTAYWQHGADIGRAEVLISLAAEAGMSTADLSQRLRSEESLSDIVEQTRQCHDIGVTTVPSLLIEGRIYAGLRAPSEYRRILDGSRRAA